MSKDKKPTSPTAENGEKPAANITEDCPLAAKARSPVTTSAPYHIEVKVITRVGEIPVQGVTVSVGDEAIGPSDKAGICPKVSTERTNDSFVVTAIYQNSSEKLKKEELTISVTEINPQSGIFKGKVENKISDVQLAVGGHMDFTQSYELPSDDEVCFVDENGKNKFVVVIKLATLSLAVPYFNQNSCNDTVTTIVGKDPEATSHSVPGHNGNKYDGSILCYPSSVLMVAQYWGQAVTRDQVMQKQYELWAKGGFVGRRDKSTDCTTSSTAPLLAANKFWLDSSNSVCFQMKYAKTILKWQNLTGKEYTPTHIGAKEPQGVPVGAIWKDTSGTPAVLKQLTASYAWDTIHESRWRTCIDGYCVWQYSEWATKYFDAIKPADGTAIYSPAPNDVFLPLTKITDADQQIERNRRYPNGAAYPSLKGETLANYVLWLSKGWPFVIGTSATSGHMMVARGIVVNKSLEVEWLIVNDPYGNLASEGSVYESTQVSAPVGIDAANTTNDVEIVQAVLGDLGFYKGTVNGLCSGKSEDLLVKAIKSFQTSAMGNKNPDGLIEPGGKTEAKLQEKAKALAHASYGAKEKGETNNATSDYGKHVYYWNNTHGVGNNLRIKGGGRGFPRIEVDMDISTIASKLTKGT